MYQAKKSVYASKQKMSVLKIEGRTNVYEKKSANANVAYTKFLSASFWRRFAVRNDKK